MHPLTVRQAFVRGNEARVVTAVDSAQRAFVGVGCGDGEMHDFVFTQVDRVSLLELDRGLVDVRTLMDERCSGIVVQATGYGELDEVMEGAVVETVPSHRVDGPF